MTPAGPRGIVADMHAALRLGLVVTLLSPACGGDPPVTMDPVRTPDPPVIAPDISEPKIDEPPKPDTSGPPAAPVGPPGPAYFAIEGAGVLRLDGGKFTKVAGSPERAVVDLQIGGDGAVWSGGYDGVLRLADDRFRKVTDADFEQLGASLDAFAVDPRGVVWAATFRGVGRFDGRAWSVEPKEKLGLGEALLRGVVADRGGKVYVLSTHALHVREGEVWRTVDLTRAGLGGEPYFGALRQGPDGALYLLASDTLLRVAPDETVTQVGLGGSNPISLADLELASNGGLVVRSGDDVIAVPAGGLPRLYEGHSGVDFSAHNISAVATDDRGRVWVGSDLGVVVLGPGDAKTEWPKGSLPELVGKVEEILVVGAGPDALPPSGPVRKGSLTGKLLQDGAPIVAAPVELCPSPSMMFHDTPCADAPIKFTTTSDEHGVWTVTDVPLGAYGIAVQLAGKWRITLGERLGEGMQADRVFDTGSLVLERR